MSRGKRNKTIAVDLDGTILQYDKFISPFHFGEPIEGAIEFLTVLREKHRILIHTARDMTNPKILGALKAHLEKHEVPYDGIHTGGSKPKASAYVDDRGVRCVPQEHGRTAYEEALQIVEILVNRP